LYSDQLDLDNIKRENSQRQKKIKRKFTTTKENFNGRKCKVRRPRG
jgi:hypothetical protein